jgi:Na+-translocating ferredoxin:NAD+ oxidoreductase RnfC subunit
MRSLVFNQVGDSLIKGSSFCCECNLCSLFACPESLDPKDACVWNKSELAAGGKKWENPDFRPRSAETLLPNRQVPTSSLMSRLDLNKFNNRGPLRDEPVRTSRVGLFLKQHIGVPASPEVKVGDRVNNGDIIASVPGKGGSIQLGLPIHASISGRVSEITKDMVWIES